MIPLAKAKGWTAADTTVIIIQGSQAGTEVNDCIRYFYVTAADSMGFGKVAPSDITALTTTIGKNGFQVDGKGTLEPSYTVAKNALRRCRPTGTSCCIRSTTIPCSAAGARSPNCSARTTPLSRAWAVPSPR